MPLRLPSLRGAPAVLLLALAAVAGCRGCGEKRRAPATPPAVASQPAELATLEIPDLKGAALPAEVEAIVSPLGTAGAFVIRSGSGARLVRGRSLGPEYPGIERVTFSPDGRHVAFLTPQAGGKVQVVLDGKADPAWDEVDGLLFTAGGELAYKARQGDHWRVVIGGRSGAPVVAIGDLVAPRDGPSLVSIEQAAAGAPFSVAAYDDGIRRRSLRDLAAEAVFLNADGTLAAAVVEEGGKRRVVVHGLAGPAASREGPPYDEVMGVGFDPGGSHVLYSARLGDDTLFAVDDRAERLPSPSLVETPVLNTARGTVGVVLVAEHAFFHLVFGPPGPAPRQYGGVTEVTFSPDGSRWAYVAEEQGRSLIVVDGAEGPVFDRAVTPRFSPDGSFLVYRARQDGKRFVVVAHSDGKVIRRLADHELVFPVTFTPDGKSMAYGVKDGPRLLWRVEPLPGR